MSMLRARPSRRPSTCTVTGRSKASCTSATRRVRKRRMREDGRRCARRVRAIRRSRHGSAPSVRSKRPSPGWPRGARRNGPRNSAFMTTANVATPARPSSDEVGHEDHLDGHRRAVPDRRRLGRSGPRRRGGPRRRRARRGSGTDRHRRARRAEDALDPRRREPSETRPAPRRSRPPGCPVGISPGPPTPRPGRITTSPGPRPHRPRAVGVGVGRRLARVSGSTPVATMTPRLMASAAARAVARVRRSGATVRDLVQDVDELADLADEVAGAELLVVEHLGEVLAAGPPCSGAHEPGVEVSGQTDTGRGLEIAQLRRRWPRGGARRSRRCPRADAWRHRRFGSALFEREARTQCCGLRDTEIVEEAPVQRLGDGQVALVEDAGENVAATVGDQSDT